MVRGTNFSFDDNPYWPDILIQPDGEVNFSCLEGLLIGAVKDLKTVKLRERVSFDVHKRLRVNGEGYLTGRASYTIGTLLRMYRNMSGRGDFNPNAGIIGLSHD